VLIQLMAKLGLAWSVVSVDRRAQLRKEAVRAG
jgi:hypothetical protein